MKLSLESRRAAESLGLRIRWTLIAAAAVLLFERLSDPLVLIAFALFVASNVIAQRVCRHLETYERRGRAFMERLRIVDGLTATGLGFFGMVRGDNVWLLGIPVLVSEAIVSRTGYRVAVLAGLMILVQLCAQLYWQSPVQSLVVAACMLALAAVVATVLATYKSRDEVLTSHDHRLATVLTCGSALAASRDLRATMLHVLRAGVVETGATCGYLMLVNEEDEGRLVTEVVYSADGEFEFPERIEIGAGISGYVAKMGQPITIADTGGAHQDYDGVTAGVRAAVSVPLVARTYSTSGQTSTEQVLGVMTLLRLSRSNTFDTDDIEILGTLGALLAVAVANAQMEERQRSTFLRTLESLATALEARDEYTQGHSQRVSEVSLMIGDRMGLNPDALEEVRIGTILHDIGKIGVPDAILNKPGKLTVEEFEVMKTHPVIGYEICKPLRLSEGVLMIIRNHHERLDGSGYPDGLKGGELPLSLRIVCVADAFDAMSSRRPYRGIMTPQKVLAEFSKGAGTQFDPVVVERLKELLRVQRMKELYDQYWEAKEARAA